MEKKILSEGRTKSLEAITRSQRALSSIPVTVPASGVGQPSDSTWLDSSIALNPRLICACCFSPFKWEHPLGYPVCALPLYTGHAGGQISCFVSSQASGSKGARPQELYPKRLSHIQTCCMLWGRRVWAWCQDWMSGCLGRGCILYMWEGRASLGVGGRLW